MGAIYSIEWQQPTTYLDQGQPVRGYVVQVRVHEFNEIFQVYVPVIDPQLIDSKVKALIAERKQLADLGG
jgi:hypothetical protein